ATSSAGGGVIGSRSLPGGGGGAGRRTTGRDGAAVAARRAAESNGAPMAGAGAREGRPSNHAAPTANRPTAVSPASRTLEGRRRDRGRVGIAGRPAIASVGMSARGGSARVAFFLTARPR